MTWIRVAERLRVRATRLSRGARPGAVRPGAADRGETLIELIISITIMSIAVVTIVGAIATSIMMSDIHRKQATAGADVRNWAETIQSAVATNGYPTCGTLPAGGAFPAQAGFVASPAPSFAVWNGSSFVPCTQAQDSGLQRITLHVSSTDNRGAESLDVVIRKPCGPTDTPCT